MLSEASINTLGFEGSLLKEWSEFQSRVEQRPTAPATREDAEQFAAYSRNDAFVDSVVDALSLYLADRNEFDPQFGGYLHLMLIQRAHDEDLALLKKLAQKYIGVGDTVSIIGLMHRVQMYSGDARLQEIADLCTAALAKVESVTDMSAWARSIGIEPENDSWTLTLKLGTAPPKYWAIRIQDLQPRDVSLELLINEAHWRVQVARVDRAYSAQWRLSGITVDTEETRLKVLSAWPMLSTPQLFPLFAAALANFLQVSWVRAGWVVSSGVTLRRPRLLDWMHTVIDDLQP
jgi:hypothetical protein